MDAKKSLPGADEGAQSSDSWTEATTVIK